jgi:hypothetical protein
MPRVSRFRLLVFAILSVAASAQAVTVDELLQSPRQFEGRRVSVSGYYYSNWEGHALYADLKAAKNNDLSRSIWISADPNVESPLRKAYIIGVFFHGSGPRKGELIRGYGFFGLWRSQLINCTVHLK